VNSALSAQGLPHIRESGLRELPRRVFWVGLLLAILERMAAWFVLGDVLPVHGFESGVISDHLVEGSGYWMPFYYCEVAIRSFIPPLYPSLMALLKMVTGEWVSVLRVIQILASIGNALLAAEIAGRWFGRRAMVWSYLLVALYPLFAIYSLAIFSTTLIMTWVLVLINLMDRIDGPRPLLIGGITGLFHALGILTSPPLGLLGILFLFRLWRYRSPGRLRRTLAYLAVLMAVWSPWVIRNHQVHGTLLLTSTNGGFNFLVGNNPHAGGYTWGEFTEEAKFWSVVDRQAVQTLPEPELERWFYRRAFSYIADDPLHYIGFFFKKVYYFWWCRDVARFGYPSPWSVAYQSVYALFLPFILIGIWFWRRRWRRLFPAFFLFAEYSTLYGCYFVRSRFRWEIEPLLLIFAVAGWFEISRRLGGRSFNEETP
jgi:4-amino-4-deoxy-L-arabinose transferase-like glycosyltransferase